MADNATPHISTEYDDQIRRTIPYYDAFHEETIRLVRVTRSPKVWVDTGCGTGNLISRALGIFPGTRFILADPSEAMIDAARKNLSGSDMSRITFLPGCPSRELGRHISEKADVVTAIQSHHYLSGEMRGKATAACLDILSPGGVYITFENIRPDSKEAFHTGMKLWRDFQISRGRDTVTVDQHLSRFDREYFPITIGEHLSLLEKSGFTSSALFWQTIMQAGFYAIR